MDRIFEQKGKERKCSEGKANIQAQNPHSQWFKVGQRAVLGRDNQDTHLYQASRSSDKHHEVLWLPPYFVPLYVYC